MIAYDVLPEHMREHAQGYLERGERPGRFLMAVLCNDFVEVAGQADEINRLCLFAWAEWLYNNVPAPAWRTKEKVEAWMKARQEEQQ